MNTILYEVVKTVGLPAGHLGEGMPDALYEGTLIKGHRIEEFLDRLQTMEAVRPHTDQSASEEVLTAPKGDAVTPPAPATSGESTAPADAGLSSKTKAELTALAESLGIEVPKSATKDAIIALIEAKQAEPAPTSPAPDAGATSNGNSDLDLSDVAGVSNAGA